MKATLGFFFGFLLATCIFGSGWYLSRQMGFPRIYPDQIPFNSKIWKESDALGRGKMYKDLIKYLESTRPKKEEVLNLLGPSGYQESAYLNGSEFYYIYHVDLGQRIAGVPYLYKFGISFRTDGSYSHCDTWD